MVNLGNASWSARYEARREVVGYTPVESHTMFAAFVQHWALNGAVLLDGLAAIVVVLAGLRAFIVVLVASVRRDSALAINPDRARLSRWLALALELMIGSDIIRTAIAPSWIDLGQLAAVIAIRLVLEYTLLREIQSNKSAGDQ
jgi:uncharacterized membrane protein